MIGQRELQEVISRCTKPTIITGRKGMGKLTLIKYMYPNAVVIGNGEDNIKVDEIRELLSQANNCTEMVYAFRNMDNMTPQSQNALLKILEECPDYLKFFLLTEELNKVLATIKSRCDIYKMRFYTHEEFEEYVRAHFAHLKKIDLLENYCFGVLGRVDRVAGKKFKDIREKCSNIVENIDSISFSNLFNISKHVEPFKDELDLFLDTLLIMYSDVSSVKLGCEDLIVDYLLLEKYKKVRITAKKASENVQIIDKYKRMTYATFNFTMLIDSLMMDLKGDAV